jgi:predicted nucleotidyltransferase
MLSREGIYKVWLFTGLREFPVNIECFKDVRGQTGNGANRAKVWNINSRQRNRKQYFASSAQPTLDWSVEGKGLCCGQGRASKICLVGKFSEGACLQGCQNLSFPAPFLCHFLLAYKRTETCFYELKIYKNASTGRARRSQSGEKNRVPCNATSSATLSDIADYVSGVRSQMNNNNHKPHLRFYEILKRIISTSSTPFNLICNPPEPPAPPAGGPQGKFLTLGPAFHLPRHSYKTNRDCFSIFLEIVVYLTQIQIDKMNKILTDRINDLKKLCEIYKVRTMYAFGSVCTDKFNKNSDIDFLISFDDLSFDQYTTNYFDLHYKLQDLFDRRIDLLTESSLSNPFFIKGVDQTKQLIYAA